MYNISKIYLNADMLPVSVDTIISLNNHHATDEVRPNAVLLLGTK